MDARTKIALSVILGILGIALATLVFSNGFLVEFSKWAPATLVSIFALWSADGARGEASESRSEAHAANAEGREARLAATAAQESAQRGERLAAQPDKDKRRVRKVEEKIAYGTGPKGAAKKAKARAAERREDRSEVKSARKG